MFESLSLRQLGRSRLFSARRCWQLSPVFAAISNLGSGPLNGGMGRKSRLFARLNLSLKLRFTEFKGSTA
jgi:hypothetical protein